MSLLTCKEQLTTKDTKKHEGQQGPTEGVQKSQAHLADDGKRHKNTLKYFVSFGAPGKAWPV